MKVTIQDIANALGISRNTVSKAINNSGSLADATRDKILRKAAEMGYKQFSYITSLSETTDPNQDPTIANSQEDKVLAVEVALFTTNISNHFSNFSANIFTKLGQELSQLGYTLSIHIVGRENIAQQTLPTTFNKMRASAIVCIEIFDRTYSEMVCTLGLPVLFIDGPNKRSGDSLPADQLYMDNTTGITKLVNNMLQQGKRKIGFIGDYELCQSIYERYTAFCSAMLLAGVPIDERFIKTDTEKLGYFLETLSEMPDLFICANDSIAVEAIQVLRKLGKSVPEDVSLCGFGDSPESRIIMPAITTIHIHLQTMAFTAAYLLITRIKNPALGYRVVYTDTDLVYRDSAKL